MVVLSLRWWWCGKRGMRRVGACRLVLCERGVLMLVRLRDRRGREGGSGGVLL